MEIEKSKKEKKKKNLEIKRDKRMSEDLVKKLKYPYN